MRRACQWILAVVASLAIAGCVEKTDTPSSAAGTPAKATLRAASMGHLQAGQARDYLASHPDALILDVRNPDEWEGELGHIEGARLIPLPELSGRMSEIEEWKERPVVVVCRSGNRSRTAAGQLIDAGFREVMNLEGGMLGWRQTEGATTP